MMKTSLIILTIAISIHCCLGLETNSKLHTMRLLYMERELLDLSTDILKKDEHFSEDIAKNDALEDYHDFRKVEK